MVLLFASLRKPQRNLKSFRKGFYAFFSFFSSIFSFFLPHCSFLFSLFSSFSSSIILLFASLRKPERKIKKFQEEAFMSFPLFFLVLFSFFPPPLAFPAANVVFIVLRKNQKDITKVSGSISWNLPLLLLHFPRRRYSSYCPHAASVQ